MIDLSLYEFEKCNYQGKCTFCGHIVPADKLYVDDRIGQWACITCIDNAKKNNTIKPYESSAILMRTQFNVDEYSNITIKKQYRIILPNGKSKFVIVKDPAIMLEDEQWTDLD